MAEGLSPVSPRGRWIAAVVWAGVSSLVLATSSPARDLNQRYKAQGLGLDTCASFLDTPLDERGLYYSWLSGYLTAYNYLVRDTYSIAEYSGLTRTNEWLEKYCGASPDHMLHQAARRFVTERYRIRLKRKPEREDVLRFQERIPGETAPSRSRRPRGES